MINKYKTELIQLQEPLVSVKMITYNHALFIAQAIEGVLQQKTTFPFELVIGEDCSTDGTREIVFDYQKMHPDIVRVVTSDENVGMKKNGLRTTRACRGKYLAFCEGDDYWQSPHKLQKQADYLEGQPECGLVYSSYDVYHVKSKHKITNFIKHRKWEMPENPSVLDILDNRGGVSRGILTCTCMIRRALWEQVVESDPYLHQSGHFLMGDAQLWAEIATKACLHYIPESLATHIITEESATRSKDIRKELRFSVSNAELMLCLCDKYNPPSHIWDKHRENWFDASLRLALHAGNAELADEVRKKKKIFTLKEWFKYYSAKNRWVYSVYRAASFVRNVMRKEDDQWL